MSTAFLYAELGELEDGIIIVEPPHRLVRLGVATIRSDDEVEETEINGKMYFTNDEKNGIIYEQDMEGDVGKKVGRFRNGVAVFNK